MAFWKSRQMRLPYLFMPFLVVLATVFAARISFAHHLQILTVNEPPANYLDPQGQSAGFAIDVVREIQRRVGNASPIKLVPEMRLMDMARANEHYTIIIGISRTPQREDHFLWITKLLVKPWILYSYRDNNSHITNLEQAKKVKVGVVHGDVREDFAVDNGFKHIVASPSHLSSLKKLMAGWLDLAFFEPQGLVYECSVNNIDASLFKPRLVPYTSDVYIAMSNNADRTIFNLWEKTAQEMKEDGTFLSIARKWSKALREKYGIASIPTSDALLFTR